MARVAERHLKKVEAALEPTEAMALWLVGAREEFASLPELAESVVQQISIEAAQLVGGQSLSFHEGEERHDALSNLLQLIRRQRL